jgi:hypothetical protein
VADRYQGNNPNYKGRNKKPQTAPEQAFIEGALRIIVQVFKMLFGKKSGSNSGTAAELRQLGESWEQVELYVLQPSTYHLAVSEGDKILDAALKIKRMPGATMADRLRAGQKLFTHDLYNQIWSAHKLRNTLAHEVGASADSGEVRSAVGTFRAALYQLGVLK